MNNLSWSGECDADRAVFTRQVARRTLGQRHPCVKGEGVVDRIGSWITHRVAGSNRLRQVPAPLLWGLAGARHDAATRRAGPRASPSAIHQL